MLWGIGIAGFGTTGSPANPPKHIARLPIPPRHPPEWVGWYCLLRLVVWWAIPPLHGAIIDRICQRFSGIKIDDKSAAQTHGMCAADQDQI